MRALKSAIPFAPVALSMLALVTPAFADPSLVPSASMSPHLDFQPIWPARGEVTTFFGETGSLSPRGHAGVDIGAPYGSPVVAMDDGEVTHAAFVASYGGLVVVAHAAGYETWYAHLSDISVAVGDRMRRGLQVGRIGSTGYSTGPHLHFEVRLSGEVVDPMQWLKVAALEPVH
jgi:murein DD-endopeptidase MepM/ murein hydrolase activator NlpD